MSMNKTKDLPDLAEKLKRSEKELTLRNENANIFLTIPDDEMYNEVLKLVLPAMESTFGAFGYIDEHRGLVVPSMTEHIWSRCQVAEKAFIFPRETWGDSTWAQAIREKRIIYSNEPSVNLPEGHIPILRHISLPILFKGEVIGLFNVANKETDYDEADIKRLELIAGFVAPELNARLQRDRYEKLGQVAKEELADSESRFRGVFEKAAIGIARVGSDGRWREVNQKLCDIVGYTREELMELTFQEITYPDDLETDLKHLHKINSGEIDVYSIEKRYIRKDGSLVWINLTTSAVRKSTREPEYFVTTIEDISKKKHAEMELKQMSQVFVNSRNPIIIEDLNGIILSVNKEAERMYGWKDDELVDWPITIVIAPERHEQTRELRERCIGGEVIRNVEGVRCDRSGRNIPVLQTLSLLTDEMGNPETVASMAQDITELKKAEKKLKKNMANTRKTMGGVIKAFSLTVESRDPYTAGHEQRVADLARNIAKEMGLDHEQIEVIRFAATIHDLGKIQVPAEILGKPGALTPLEFEMIKLHPETGYQILKDVDFPWDIAQIVRQHHERLDDSGYPQGISGEDIGLESRIIAIADVVEAMSSHRPYRPALGIDQALEEIVGKKGVAFDADAVDACVRIFKAGYHFDIDGQQELITGGKA